MAKAVARFSSDAWTEAGAVAQVCIQKVRSPEEGLADPLLLEDISQLARRHERIYELFKGFRQRIGVPDPITISEE